MMSTTGPVIAANLPMRRRRHKPVLSLTSPEGGFYIGLVKWRNQLLALLCLLLFGAFGVFYFRHWVVQKPFGIILFIGAGLAPDRVAAARIYGGGADTQLTLDELTYTAFLKNYSKDFATPDTAAAATALATGVKVPNGSLGIDENGKTLSNLLEIARQSGRATGLVTNMPLTGPTAASFYAHTSDKTERQALARELVENARIDVVLGGGSADFLPEIKGGRRTDDRDLLLEIRRAGYDLARTRAELEAIPRWRRPKLFGVFSANELAFADQAEARADQLSLADMVRRAIELLQFNQGGYLLVVDAGLMGKAARENRGEQTLVETLELDRAVSVALRYAGTNSTVIVCGDAAIGGMSLNGSPFREDSGVAVLGLNSAGDPWITWSTGPNGPISAKPARTEAADSSGAAEPSPSPAAESQEPAAVYAESALHTAEDVVAFGSGRGAEALHGTIENTAVFHLIRDNL
jgi:alkaline phosphatase